MSDRLNVQLQSLKGENVKFIQLGSCKGVSDTVGNKWLLYNHQVCGVGVIFIFRNLPVPLRKVHLEQKTLK